VLPEQVPNTPENMVGVQRLEENNKALKSAMGTKEGRLVFSEMFKLFYMFKSPHNDHGAKTSFQCGQQSVCLWFREWMKTAGIYELYQLMEKEDMERQEHWDGVLKNLVEKPQGRK